MKTIAVLVAVASIAFGVQGQPNALSPAKRADLLQSRKAWGAFECAALAGKMGDQAEQSRLFIYGLAQGRAFLKAAEAARFTGQDMAQVVPVGFLLVMEGPSHDFILGRLWEQTVESALRDVLHGPDRTLLADDISRTKAQSKFTNANCSVLGR